ncbi:hypothetical protein XENTR_v10021328 [Xenopus tropicalis]|nr:hypothetical protein XENTR_v10021328 [Xenopus tropicalis]
MASSTASNPRSSPKSTNAFTTSIDEASSKLDKLQTVTNPFSLGTITFLKTNSAQSMENTASQPTISTTKPVIWKTSIQPPSTFTSNSNDNNGTIFARSTEVSVDTTSQPLLQKSLTSPSTTNTYLALNYTTQDLHSTERSRAPATKSFASSKTISVSLYSLSETANSEMHTGRHQSTLLMETSTPNVFSSQSSSTKTTYTATALSNHQSASIGKEEPSTNIEQTSYLVPTRRAELSDTASSQSNGFLEMFSSKVASSQSKSTNIVYSVKTQFSYPLSSTNYIVSLPITTSHSSTRRTPSTTRRMLSHSTLIDKSDFFSLLTSSQPLLTNRASSARNQPLSSSNTEYIPIIETTKQMLSGHGWTSHNTENNHSRSNIFTEGLASNVTSSKYLSAITVYFASINSSNKSLSTKNIQSSDSGDTSQAATTYSLSPSLVKSQSISASIRETSPTSAISHLSSLWNLTSKHQLLRVSTVNNMSNNQPSSTSSSGYLSIAKTTNQPHTTLLVAQTTTSYKSPLNTSTENYPLDVTSRKFITTNKMSSIKNGASALVSSTAGMLSSVNIVSNKQSFLTSKTTSQPNSNYKVVSFSLFNSGSTPYPNMTSRQSLLTDTVTSSSLKVRNHSASTIHTTPFSNTERNTQQQSSKYLTTFNAQSRNIKMSTTAVANNLQTFTLDLVSAVTRYIAQSTLINNRATSANTTLTSSNRTTLSTSTSPKPKLTSHIVTLSSKIASAKPTNTVPHSTTESRSYSLPRTNFAISSGISIHPKSTSRSSEPYTNKSNTLINNSSSSTTISNKLSSNSKITKANVIGNSTFLFSTKMTTTKSFNESKAPSSEVTPEALTSKVATSGGSSVASSTKSLSFLAIALFSLAVITGTALVAY